MPAIIDAVIITFTTIIVFATKLKYHIFSFLATSFASSILSYGPTGHNRDLKYIYT